MTDETPEDDQDSEPTTMAPAGESPTDAEVIADAPETDDTNRGQQV